MTIKIRKKKNATYELPMTATAMRECAQIFRHAVSGRTCVPRDENTHSGGKPRPCCTTLDRPKNEIKESGEGSGWAAEESEFDSRQKPEILKRRQNRFWGPPSLPHNGYLGFYNWGVKLTLNVYLVPRLRIIWIHTSPPHLSSWRR
jgi:hypothetical protein